jgi:hypothetical protein
MQGGWDVGEARRHDQSPECHCCGEEEKTGISSLGVWLVIVMVSFDYNGIV